MTLFGGLETGGTKCVCVVGQGQTIQERYVVPTTSPEATLTAVVEFFRRFALSGLGVGSFGPVDINPHSLHFGELLSTPKLAWRGFNVVAFLKNKLNVPIALDQDVNGSALGEAVFGAGRGYDPLIYFTIGTGIGAGLIVNQKPLHGLMHSESGHIALPRIPGDNLPSACPFHSSCFEGLASGPAIHQRFGDPQSLGDDHMAWMYETEYIGQALATISLVLSPARIILGGGVMQHAGLLPGIRAACARQLNGYLSWLGDRITSEDYIVEPGLGNDSGAIGALILAESATPSPTASSRAERLARSGPHPQPLSRGTGEGSPERSEGRGEG